MIFATTAANDKDLRAQLKKRLGAIPIFTAIPHGDVNIVGKWRNGDGYRALVERKKLGDIISCIENGRYLAQWQQAREAGWEDMWFCAEIDKSFREDPHTGMIRVKRGNKWYDMKPTFMWSRVEDFLFQIQWILGVKLIRTSSPEETGRAVARLYQMYSDPPENHKTLQKIFTPACGDKNEDVVSRLFNKPSVLRKVAVQLPGIGWERSKDVELVFGSIRELALADVPQWRAVPGIGKKVATQVVEELRRDVRPPLPGGNNIEDLY